MAKALAPALRRATARAAAVSKSSGASVLKVVIRHEDRLEDEEDDLDAPRLTLETYQEDGVRRRWRLFYEIAQAEEPAVDDERSGEISCHPLQFASIFDHVGPGSVEVAVTDDTLAVSTRARDDQSRTSLAVDRHDLDIFEPTPQAKDGFAFLGKEARAAVKFCENADVSDLSFRFSGAGEPAAFKAKAPSGCAMHFLLSTTASTVRHRDQRSRAAPQDDAMDGA